MIIYGPNIDIPVVQRTTKTHPGQHVLYPPEPGYYFCHVSVQALLAFLPSHFWDGQCWCTDDSPSRTPLAMQTKYWAEMKDGATVYLTPDPSRQYRLGLF